MLVALYYFISSVVIIRHLKRSKHSFEVEASDDCGIRTLTLPWVYNTFEYLVDRDQDNTICAMVFCGFSFLLVLSISVISTIAASWMKAFASQAVFWPVFGMYMVTEGMTIMLVLTCFFLVRVVNICILVSRTRYRIKKTQGVTNEEEMRQHMTEADIHEKEEEQPNEDWKNNPKVQEIIERRNKEKERIKNLNKPPDAGKSENEP
jgi:uncharacterized membrane protein